MRFAMIFEGIDRATKVMNKIMAAEKKTAAAVKAGSKATQSAADNATKATQKQTSALGKLGSVARGAYNGVVAGARAAGRATVALHKQTVALGKSGFKQIESGARKTFRGMAVAAGLAATAVGGSALAAGQLLDTAKQFESYRIQLETLEGSSEKGKKALDWITEFAVKTPLELDQVVEAYRNLKTFGLDPTDGTLMSLVDTMAATGKGSEQLEGLTLAVGQAWTKQKLQGEEALQLLERGVPVWDILSKKYKKNAAELQEMASKGELGRDAIRYLVEEMGRRSAGASDKMSKTWEGMTSNLSDIWLQFKLAVMDAGLFEWMKSKLQLVLDTVNSMADDGTLQQWAEYISTRLTQILNAAWQFAVRVYGVLQQLGTYLVAAKDYVGSWERLAAILGALAFAPVLISTAAGIVQIAMGITMLSAALMANPIVLLIMAIVAAAAAIYIYWGPIKEFFIGLWNSIAAGASALWEKLKSLLGFDPLSVLKTAFSWSPIGLVIQNWGSIQSTIQGFIGTIPGIVTGAWDLVKTAFSWTPAGMIIQNWGSIQSTIQGFISAIPGIVTGAWDLVKTAFSWTPTGLIIQNWDGISGAVSAAVQNAFQAVDGVWTSIKSIFDWVPTETITTAWAGISDTIGGLIDGATARVASAWNKVKSVFTFSGGDTEANISVTDPATIQAAQMATAALKTDMQAVAAIDTATAMGKLAALETSAQQVSASVTSSIRQAEAFLNNVSFYNQGVALMDTMAAGIRARAAVVTAEIQKMAQAVRDHLPSSPAKVGPLSDIHKLKFAETIASSIRPAPMVRAMRGAAAATLAAASISGATVPVSAQPVAGAAVRSEVAARSQSASIAQSQSGGGVHIEYKPTLSLSGDAQTAKADLKKELSSHARHIAKLVDEERRKSNRRKP
ncbi:tape measure protein [Ochrobactrum sp. BTU2]|uniref:tape measure protein n=1 Tax=Ochrobactrum sp. BTU2 TaxID=2856166 RepID=UPI00211A9B9C|nr:tape measure protein [Ochrobactrum sp. BTU2]MCQ9145847.1 tape measure protein [Ochrobactrum sp. BTU2]